MRLDSCSRCAARWFITFDSQECKRTSIDGIIYTHNAPTVNVHRPAVIRGHCKLNKSGAVDVAFNVGALSTWPKVHVLTGWSSSMRIYIEEVEAPQQ